MPASRACVTVCKMLFSGKALKVFRAVVSFVAVDVVNMFVRVKRIQPTSSHDTVRKPTFTQCGIPIKARQRNVRLELSENFSAARNGVKVVKESVLDSVYRYANHAVPLTVAKES